ncbi:MAG: hypothetical protein K2G50_02345, partial [Anaeroplasmataceae bacterium]|nr:hypothetical protein [Anaeroplasmataceae bacterium]
MDIKIGIKDLAIFACQSGDLTNEFFSNRDLENGTKAHRYLQSKYQEGSQKEVYIKTAITYYQQKLILHGFIDGVINDRGNIIIEEIKSTLKDLDEVSLLDRPEYFAQAKIYGYLYALEHSMDPITLRLTYISAVDYSTRSFDSVLSLDELEEFVFDCLDKYMVWYNLQQDALNKKEETISSVKFPFSNMRPGQRDMMRACYQTMKAEDILYCIAPTGIGKTMGTMFSSLKTLEKNDKLFYLTAKGSGKNAPINAIRILEEKGLKIKTIN